MQQADSALSHLLSLTLRGVSTSAPLSNNSSAYRRLTHPEPHSSSSTTTTTMITPWSSTIFIQTAHLSLAPSFAQLFASAAPHPFFLPFSFFCQSDDKRSIDTDPMQNHQSRDGTAPLVPLSRVSNTEQLTRLLSVSHHPIVPPHSISPPSNVCLACSTRPHFEALSPLTIGNAVLRVRCQHCQQCQQLLLPATLPCSHAAPAQPPNPTRRPIGFRACLSTTDNH